MLGEINIKIASLVECLLKNMVHNTYLSRKPILVSKVRYNW